MNGRKEANDGVRARNGNASRENGPRAPANLRPIEVAILGALGGIVAGVVAFPIDDLFSDIRALYSSIFCAILGGIWSYVQIPEHSRIRAFQLGIVAPAAISALTYANTNASDKGILNPIYELPDASTQMRGHLENRQFPAVFIYAQHVDGRIVTLEHGPAKSADGTPIIMYAKKPNDEDKNSSWWERVVG